MAVALVGSLGTVATGTTSVSPTFAQSTTAGNCLVLWVVSVGGGISATPPTGWATGRRDSAGTAAIFFKANCGAGETAPTISGATFMAAQLAEFSGVSTATVPRDTGADLNLTSPDTMSAVAADPTLGNLMLGISLYIYSMGAIKTTSHAYNNGGTALNNANNDATSTANHYRFSYAITTSNSVADALTDTFTITNIGARSGILVSLDVAAVVVPVPVSPTTKPLPFIPRGRSM